MPDLQDTLSQMMRDPETMRQVQQLGKQLGLSGSAPPAAPPAPPPLTGDNASMMTALTKLAPLMSAARPNDETAALLNALRPFLGEEKRKRLDSAQRLIGLMRLLPLLRDSGLF